MAAILRLTIPVSGRWKASKAEMEAEYAKELAQAKSIHQQRVARIRRQWEKEQKARIHAQRPFASLVSTRAANVAGAA